MKTLRLIPILLPFLVCFSLKAYDLEKEIKYDLDGDGKPETILVTGKDDGAEVQINKKKLMIPQLIESFEIIDIQTSDKQKEIALKGSMDFDPVYIVSWSKNKIVLLGKSFSPESKGNGIVYSSSWQGFWSKKDKFTLDPKSNSLKLSPQTFHYVGQPGKVEKSFPIYSDEERKFILAHLKKDTEITILLARVNLEDSSKTLYLVKSESNLLGWITEKDIQEFLSGINWAG